MHDQVEKSKENNSRAVANSVAQKISNEKQAFEFVDNRFNGIQKLGFVDNRQETVTQRNLMKILDTPNNHDVIQCQFFSKLLPRLGMTAGFYSATNVLFRKIDDFRMESQLPEEVYKPSDSIEMTLRVYEAFNGGVSIGNLKAKHVWLQVDDKVLVQRGDGKPDQTNYEPLEKTTITGQQMNYLLHYQKTKKLADLLYMPVLNDCHTRISDAQNFSGIDSQIKTPRFGSI